MEIYQQAGYKKTIMEKEKILKELQELEIKLVKCGEELQNKMEEWGELRWKKKDLEFELSKLEHELKNI